jgi:hypothetical protein
MNAPLVAASTVGCVLGAVSQAVTADGQPVGVTVLLMYEFHWLDVPFCPGTSWAIVKLKSAAGRPCKNAPFSLVSWNFTTGGPLIVTLMIVPVIAVAVLTLSADPVVEGPVGPVGPVAPAGPDEPVVPLQAASNTQSTPEPNTAAPG